MAKPDRDAYDLEPTPERREVLNFAVHGMLAVHGATTIAHADLGLSFSPAHQQAYLDLARAGLLIGSDYTGKGHRAAKDWGLIT